MPDSHDSSEGPAHSAPPSEPSAKARRMAALALLPRFPRFAFRVVEACNREPLATLLVAVQRLFLEPLVFVLLLWRRLHVHGLERLAGVPPGASVLVVSNHRSFFDLFVVGWVLLNRAGLRRRVCFPVRANFFYENPVGLFLNVVFSGASMFPPIFRTQAQRQFNQYAVTLLVERLRAPGSLVGFHPEGTRNKGADPYTLLPAKTGAGELALHARPQAVVVPVFVNGTTNALFKEVLDNLRGRRPIWLVVGAPVDVSRWPAVTRHAHHAECSEALLAEIAALGAEEKALRQASAATT